jgi:hypothetical protein
VKGEVLRSALLNPPKWIGTLRLPRERSGRRRDRLLLSQAWITRRRVLETSA